VANAVADPRARIQGQTSACGLWFCIILINPHATCFSYHVAHTKHEAKKIFKNSPRNTPSQIQGKPYGAGIGTQTENSTRVFVLKG